MTERVARERKIVHHKRRFARRLARQNRLAKIGVRIEKAKEAFDSYVFEFPRQMRYRIVPADLAVGNNLEAGLHLIGNRAASHFVFGVEHIRHGALAAIEACNRAPQHLELESVADSRIAARAREIQTRRSWIHGSESNVGERPERVKTRRAFATRSRCTPLRFGLLFAHGEIRAIRMMEDERAYACFRVHHHAFGEVDADIFGSGAASKCRPDLRELGHAG